VDFPLSASEISLWIAVTALILLVTSELIYASSDFASRTLVDKKRLRYAAIGMGLAFLATVVIRVFQPF